MVITIAFQVYIDWFWKPAQLDVAYLHDTPANISKPHPYVTPIDSRASGDAPLLENDHVKENGLGDKEQVPEPVQNGHAGESDEDKYGFLPPSMWQQQPGVWIADDKHGLGKIEVARIRAGGVDATTDGATMDEKGGISGC